MNDKPEVFGFEEKAKELGISKQEFVDALLKAAGYSWDQKGKLYTKDGNKVTCKYCNYWIRKQRLGGIDANFLVCGNDMCIWEYSNDVADEELEYEAKNLHDFVAGRIEGECGFCGFKVDDAIHSKG